MKATNTETVALVYCIDNANNMYISVTHANCKDNMIAEVEAWWRDEIDQANYYINQLREKPFLYDLVRASGILPKPIENPTDFIDWDYVWEYYADARIGSE